MDPYMAMMGQPLDEERRMALAQALRGTAASGGALSTSSIGEVSNQGRLMQAQAQDAAQVIGQRDLQREQLAAQERMSLARTMAMLDRSKGDDDPFNKITSSEREKIGAEMTANQRQSFLIDSWSPKFQQRTLGKVGLAAVNMGLPVGGFEDAVSFWKNYAQWENQVRNQLFGSALTAQESALWERATLNPNLSESVAKDYMKTQNLLVQKAQALQAANKIAMGWPKDIIKRTYPMVPSSAYEDLDAFAAQKSQEAKDFFEQKAVLRSGLDFEDENLDTLDDDQLLELGASLGITP